MFRVQRVIKRAEIPCPSEISTRRTMFCLYVSEPIFLSGVCFRQGRYVEGKGVGWASELFLKFRGRSYSLDHQSLRALIVREYLEREPIGLRSVLPQSTIRGVKGGKK